ncbi:MAG: hypothetical protein WC455_13075 [Dehalococcoidia bacterium]|jgi:hypothetical protein
MNAIITEVQAPQTAQTGEIIRPYCTVSLPDGSPATGVALGWWDDVNGQGVEFDSFTILSSNHPYEVLRPSERVMPSTTTTFKLALFLPVGAEELGYSEEEIVELEEMGIYWVRTDSVLSFTVENSSNGGGDDDEDEGGLSRTQLIVGASFLGLLTVVGLGALFMRRR